MKILKAIERVIFGKAALQSIDNRGGWFPWIREPYSGAWQQNDEWTVDNVLAFHAVYACITLIANDIGKLKFKLTRLDSNKIWVEFKDAAKNAVLRRPNNFQNGIQFREYWMLSKLINGNTYVLIGRNARGEIVNFWVLDSQRVSIFVTPIGEVMYQLNCDNLAGIQESSIMVPASEIIHDRMNCLFHPLVGTSPLFASGLSASHGLKIQNNSAKFFENGSRPSGLLTAPGSISDETADRLKLHWDSNYSGVNAGKVAVLGDGLKFEKLTMTAEEAQLIEQLKYTAEIVCSTFHVPPYKIGVGTMPTHDNIEALTQDYYSQCLQSLIEAMEASIDYAFGFIDDRRVELDLELLFRMDTQTRITTLGDAISKSVMAPNEARKKINLAPVPGGNSIYLQQQNYSLEALARRDAQPDPFNPSATTEPETAEVDEDDDELEPEEQMRLFSDLLRLELRNEA